MFKKPFLSLVVTACLITLNFPPPARAAASFNFNYIISDYEFTDATSLDLAGIQNFLERRSGTLKNYIALDVNGERKTAAEIIYQASREYKINPKYLLVLLQKEQSLLDNPNPTEYAYRWATGYARCDSCDPEDPRVAIFGGFGKQIHHAARRNREYIENPQDFNFKISESYNVDGYTVTPVNQATVNLLIYTPHYNGNYNFWWLWHKYFVPSYPDGTLLQEEGQPGVWVIKNGLKRPFASKSALLTRYDINKIITVSKSDLEKYDEGPPIKFAQYSLLQAPTGTVYLIVADERRGIASGEVFRTLGFNREEVEKVTWEDLVDVPEGTSITMDSAYPAGGLLQNKTTGGVFYVKEGMKYPIWHRDIMKINYSALTITPVDPAELEKYLQAGPAKLRDGELITSPNNPGVYVISNGEKRPIVSEEAFEQLGYKWENIIETADKVLEIHPTGEDLDIYPADSSAEISVEEISEVDEKTGPTQREVTIIKIGDKEVSEFEEEPEIIPIGTGRGVYY